MATTITIAEQQVVVECDPGITNPQPAIESKPFQEWKESIEGHKGLRVKKVTIQGIDMFGPRVGFVKFKADVELDGQFVPGIVFMRGGAVAILVVLVSGDEEYVVLTKQARVPIGEISYPEIPAGMLDGNGEFAGVAAKELKEEADLHIRSSELIDMTNLAYGSKFRGVYPSPGGCDEYIRLFLYKREVTVEELTAIRGKSGLGDREEGELISLDVVPLSELYTATSDGKALAALCLYDNLRRDRKISGASATRPGGPIVPTRPVGGSPNRARLRPGTSWIGGAEQETGVDIVVLGEAHLDLSCSPTNSNVADFGMSIKAGPQDLGSFDIALGGKGAIEAVCIARLGFDTHFFTKFGTLHDEAQASQRVDDEAQASQDELDFAAKFMVRCLQCQTDGANKQRLDIHWSKEQSEVKEKHCKMQLASGACVILQNGSTNSNLNKQARLKHDDGVRAAKHALENKASFLLLQDEVGSAVIETAVKITTRGDGDGDGDIAHSQSRTRNVLTCWPRKGLDPEQNLQHLDVLVLQWRNLKDACPDRSARDELFKDGWNMKDGMTAVTAIRSRMRGADSKNPDLRVEAKVVINTFENYVYIHGPGGPTVVPIPESKSENGVKADFVATHDSMAGALVAGMMKPPDRETSKDSSRTFRCAAVRGAYMLAFSRSGSGMHLPIDESAFDAFISKYSGEEAMTGEFVAEEEHAVQLLERKLLEEVRKIQHHRAKGVTGIKEWHEGLKQEIDKAESVGMSTSDASLDTHGSLEMILQGDPAAADVGLTSKNWDWQLQTPLHLAVLLGHAELVMALLATEEGRGMIECKDIYGIEPENAARGHLRKEVSERIKGAFDVRRSIESIKKDPENEEKSLDLLSKLEKLKVGEDDKLIEFALKELIDLTKSKSPVLMEQPDYWEKSAVHWAAKMGSQSALRLFADNALLDLDHKDKQYRNSPAHTVLEHCKNDENAAQALAFLFSRKDLSSILLDENGEGSTVMKLMVDKSLQDARDDAVVDDRRLLNAVLRALAVFQGEEDESQRAIVLNAEYEKVSKQLPKGMTHHFFLSHYQANAGDACGILCETLKKRHFKVWYDKEAEDVNEEAMMAGVEKSEVFILFLSEGVFTRHFCRLEIKKAVESKKHIMTLLEEDPRKGNFDFAKEREKLVDVPEDFRDIASNIMDKYEAMPFRRRDYEKVAMLNQIEKLYFKYREKKAKERVSRPSQAQIRGSMAVFDTNHDGVLDEQEYAHALTAENESAAYQLQLTSSSATGARRRAGSGDAGEGEGGGD